MRAARIIGEPWKQASTLTSPNRPNRPSWRRWSPPSRGGYRAAPNEFPDPVEAREDDVAWSPSITLERGQVPPFEGVADHEADEGARPTGTSAARLSSQAVFPRGPNVRCLCGRP